MEYSSYSLYNLLVGFAFVFDVRTQIRTPPSHSSSEPITLMLPIVEIRSSGPTSAIRGCACVSLADEVIGELHDDGAER